MCLLSPPKIWAPESNCKWYHWHKLWYYSDTLLWHRSARTYKDCGTHIWNFALKFKTNPAPWTFCLHLKFQVLGAHCLYRLSNPIYSCSSAAEEDWLWTLCTKSMSDSSQMWSKSFSTWSPVVAKDLSSIRYIFTTMFLRLAIKTLAHWLFSFFVKIHTHDVWVPLRSPMSITLKVTHYNWMRVPRNRWFMYLAVKPRRSVRMLRISLTCSSRIICFSQIEGLNLSADSTCQETQCRRDP